MTDDTDATAPAVFQRAGDAPAYSPAPPAPPSATDPLLMLIERVVTDPNADFDKLDRLLAMREKIAHEASRKAYMHARAAAKGKIPPILKDGQVSHETKGGGQKTFRHETLAGIARIIDPILAEHGLSYRFRTVQNEQRVSVTCIIFHEQGFEEETTLSGPGDPSGGKNAYQAVGSATTYLQRYTLRLALGLSAATDDDAKSAGPQPDDADPKPDGAGRPATQPAGPDPAEIRAVAERFATKLAEELKHAETVEELGHLWHGAKHGLTNLKHDAPDALRRLNDLKDDMKTRIAEAERQRQNHDARNDDLDDEIPF